MADTRRELAALQTALADNTTGAITPQVARDVLISEHPAKIHQVTASGSPPADPVTGDVWHPSDGIALPRWNGTDWHDVWGPNYPLVSPKKQTWAWDNQNAAVETDVGQGLCLDRTAYGVAVQMRYKAVPSGPYQIDVLLSCLLNPGVGGGGGVAIGWSDGTKWVTLLFSLSTSTYTNLAYVRKWTNWTTYSADYAGTGNYYISIGGPAVFVRIEDDNTNRKISLSTNGRRWNLFHSIGRTDFLTPTRVGWGIYANNTDAQATLHSWYEH